MRWPGTWLCTVIGVTLGGALVMGGCGSATRAMQSPRASGLASADIAFTFGGRIHLLWPDGSGRVRLTGSPHARQGGGDFEPAWSPDGTALAFARGFESRSGISRSRIYILRPEAEHPQRLDVKGDVLSPAWSPDGERIALARFTDAGGSIESEIVVADLNGGTEQVVRHQPASNYSLKLLAEPAWSPDGTRIAFTLITLDRRSYFHQTLYVIDADGGEPSLLAKDAGGAAWSPDGSRIAYTSTRDHNGKSCYDECSYKGELYVMDADGTDQVRLTRNRGDDRSASWSPDGRRIVFASDRNHPQPGGHEIYSIGADGSCLTWLTNGAPDSRDPAWRPTATSASDPGGCGATRRPAVVEVDVRRAGAVRRAPAYWLGKRFGGLLLGNVSVWRDRRSRLNYFFAYDDCARYQPSACPPGLQLQEVSVCSRSGQSTFVVLDQPHYGHRVRAFTARGMLFVDIGQGDLSVIAGTTHVRVSPSFHRLARRELSEVVRSLRRVGGSAAALPPPAMPRVLLRRLHQAENAFRRLGTLDAAARALGIPTEQARRRLELARAVRTLPRVRAIACRSFVHGG